MDPRVEELTKSIIARHLGLRRDQIKLGQYFGRDLHCDNLALIGIALDIEDLEHTEFPFGMLEHIDTVSDLVELVESVLGASGAPASALVKSRAQRLTA